MRGIRCAARSLTVAALASLLAVSAFAQSPSPAPAGPGAPTLEGTEWLLTQLTADGTLAPVAPGSPATLLLDEGAASGSTGCNRWFADHTLDGDSLVFGPVASTLMLCDEPASSLETQYVTSLALVAGYALDGTSLSLLDAAGAPTLVYEAAAGAPVVGAWVVSVFADDTGVAVPPVAGSELTAVFGADGTIAGSSGCNRFAGSYTMDSDSLAIGPLASTKMLCADPALDAQEIAYLAALAASTGATLAPTGLVLTDAVGAVTVVFAPADVASYLGDWVVTGYSNGAEAVVSPIAGSSLTVTFAADGSISGSTGCNEYFGSYVVSEASIAIGPLATTFAACPTEELSAQQAQFLAALGAAATWEGGTDLLVLRDAAGAMQLNLIPAGAVVVPTATPKPTPTPTATPKPSNPLKDTAWTLDGYRGSDDKPVALPPDLPLTAYFTGKQISGFAGCNDFTASYTRSGDKIDITDILTTRLVCADDLMGIESTYLEALRHVNRWDLKQDPDKGKLLLLTRANDPLRLRYVVSVSPR